MLLHRHSTHRRLRVVADRERDAAANAAWARRGDAVQAALRAKANRVTAAGVGGLS